jgi:transcriptional regulator with XRE-family HTH domain
MPTPIAQSVAAELRAEIARQSLTQQELAERLGERQWWVSRRVTGEVSVTAEDLVRFAAALGVPAAQFLKEVPA